MKPAFPIWKPVLVACATLFLASLAIAPSSDELAFSVSKGTKLGKHFEMSVELEKKSASLSIGGHEMPKELLEKIEMSFTMAETNEIEDEYVELDGARPKELVRSYRKATQHATKHIVMVDADPDDEKEDLESPLVDHAVRFTWNPKEEKYEREFRGEKGQAEWLEKLKEDTDFRGLLPDGKVEVGQTWKVDPKELNQLVMPGGDVPFEKKDKDDELDFDKNISGEAEAKYKGTREVDGEKVGVIALMGKLSTHHETENEGAPMKIAIHYELEGELLWDLEKKHMRSYELHGPAEFTMSGTQEVEGNGQKLEMKMRFELAGEMKATGSVDR
jgi:hypothetical protein